MTPEFVHLHVHSEYSLLDGAARLRDLVKSAAALGMSSLALTDHGVMYGVVDFYKLCKEYGIHPIIGCEAYMAMRGRLDKTPHVDSSQYHLVLLAENDTGYKNLLQLVSKAHLEGFYYKPRLDRELLAEHSEGLIAMSACLAGEVPTALMAGDRKKALEAAAAYRDIFGSNNFFLEMMEHGLPEQQKVNVGIREISKELGIPLVATNDLHYVRREDASVQDVLLCIQTGKTLDEENRMRFESQEFYLKSPAEMAAVFPDDPEALRRTLEIAERCHVEFDFSQLYLPEFRVPQGEDLNSYLTKLCLEGLNRRFPGGIPQAAQERLDYELGVLRRMGFAGYFLIVQDFINWARGQGILVGPGRGSAAGSLVSYALGITGLDPLKYGLLFERFLNPERISMPDIDTDICYERRGEVLDYVVGKYGADHVAQIITFGTMLARGAIRDVGRVLNMPLAEVDRIAKLVPEELGMTLDRALETSPDLKQAYEESPEAQRLLDLARAIEGMPRHASTHAAGVVITRDPLTHYVPLQRTGDVVTTQFPMGTVEQIGLLKMDLLGLRTLTVIGEALRIIESRGGPKLDLDRLPLDDPATYEMLSSGETVGVFQVESSGMRHILRNLKPQRFEDLVPLVALYRPGPLKSGMVDDFISRKNAQTRVEYQHPVLQSILSETYGVILYQEQVMRISSDLAGFSMAEADTLRKAMGKKKPEVIAKMRESFVKGAGERQVDTKTAGSIFDLMENFAGYGFNKSHSAAYALIAYQTAYLKANHPVSLLAALLTSVRGNFDKVSYYIQECRRLDIEILPPDVNESLTTFTEVGEKRIRFGLGAVKNVGEGAVAAIIEARDRGGPFRSLDDFCERVDMRQVNRRVVESLILCGAYDSLQAHRSQLMAVLDECLDTAQANRRDQGAQADGQVSLFDILDEPKGGFIQRSLPPMKEFPPRELLAYEKEMLGFYVSGHPLEGSEDILAGRTSFSIGELAQCQEGDRVTLGGIVSGLKRGTTRRGDGKITFNIEDMGGSVEIVYIQKSGGKKSPSKTFRLPENDDVVLVKGRVSQQDESYRIFADDITPLDARPVQAADHILYIRINPLAGSPDMVERLRVLFMQHRGVTPVLLYFVRQKTLIKTDASFWMETSPELCYKIEELCGPGSCFLLDRESDLQAEPGRCDEPGLLEQPGEAGAAGATAI
jgi:DNA polymerase-3 subunit alpha